MAKPSDHLTARLDLLEGAAVITPTARQLTEASIARVEHEYGLRLDEADAMLVTHVAMALARVERGELAPTVPDIVGDEIADRQDEREFASAMAAEWERALARPIPVEEIAYLTLHLAAIRERSGGGP